MDALVTGVEVNDSHGVGIFLRRLFPVSEEFVVFRSRTLYGGTNDFGGREVFIGGRFGSVDELRQRLRAEGAGVERILCVPYFPEDFRVAALLKEVTGAQLCTYVMDDQNVVKREVGDAVVRRLVEASDLCLGISPRMCAEYGAKFGKKFWWLPPVVGELAGGNAERRRGSEDRKRCALLGNFWSARQLKDFRETVRGSGWSVDWYGKGPEASWLSGEATALTDDGIEVQGFLPDQELVDRLAGYDFAVVPSGRMDSDDDKLAFSALSFPSRMIYLFTQAGLPVLLVGSEDSAAGRFLTATGSGVISPYNQQDFVAAADRLVADRDRIRPAVDQVAKTMVLPEGGGWIWRSLAVGQAVDDRFEQMMGQAGAMGGWGAPEIPAVVRRWWEFDFAKWRYSRKAQLAWIRRKTPLEAMGPHSFAVGAYQRALASALIRKFVRKGKRVGLLSGELSDLRPILKDYKVEITGDEDTKYDAVVSFEMEESVSREGLRELGDIGALQLHFWTGFVHPQHVEVADAGRRLLDETEDAELLMERIMDDAGFLFMSPRAIKRFWPTANAEEIGRPFSLNLIWRD